MNFWRNPGNPGKGVSLLKRGSVMYKTIFVINIIIYICLQHYNVFVNLKLQFSYF